jgi:hypothetical protein
MDIRKLGNSDLQITPVGYGAWAIGGSGWDFAWGHQDDGDSISAIHRSVELGVNWIDTAAVYGIGHSEEMVAKALKDWRGARPYVFTVRSPLGRQRPCDPGPLRQSIRKESRQPSPLASQSHRPLSNALAPLTTGAAWKGLANHGRPPKGRKSSLDWRIKLQRRATKARRKNC